MEIIIRKVVILKFFYKFILDATKEEIEKWIETLSEEDKVKAKGFFHLIRRDEKGHLKLVSYSEEYKVNLLIKYID